MIYLTQCCWFGTKYAQDELRTLNRNTFDSNLMSVQSDCPHRERFGAENASFFAIHTESHLFTETGSGQT